MLELKQKNITCGSEYLPQIRKKLIDIELKRKRGKRGERRERKTETEEPTDRETCTERQRA